MYSESARIMSFELYCIIKVLIIYAPSLAFMLCWPSVRYLSLWINVASVSSLGHLLAMLPLQIQFGLTIFHALCAVVWPCGFSLGWLYFHISYMLTLVIFFLNFYIQVSCFFTLYDIICDKSGCFFGKTQLITGRCAFFPPLTHKTYKKQKASLKKDHQNGSTALKNGHAKANPAAAHKKRRVD